MLTSVLSVHHFHEVLMRSILLSLALLLLASIPTHASAVDPFRASIPCALMASDGGGLTYFGPTKAVGVDRVLRTPLTIPEGECVSYVEISGSTTAPGGPVGAYVYLLRSGAVVTLGKTTIPEGKAGTYKAAFSQVCAREGDIFWSVVTLNAGGGVPYEAASCSYISVGE
jgi:hypothetical protein